MTPIYLVASGDRLLAVNQQSWPAQTALEEKISAALGRLGRPAQRAHGFDASKTHGFIDSQRRGLEAFRNLPADASVIVVGTARQGGRFVWPGLSTHRGPILTIAHWSAPGPGIAGLLDLNGCLARAGIKYSSLWSETFEDEWFTAGLRRWLEKGKVKHDTGHVRPFDLKPKDAPADLGDFMRTGREFARRLKKEKAILGVFGGGGAGIDDVSVPTALLAAAGVFKEGLSGAELAAKMAGVREEEALAIHDWYAQRGARLHLPEETRDRVLEQCRRYVAWVRLADEFGCAAVGVPSWHPGDDPSAREWLAATCNHTERPPVYHEENGQELFPGGSLPCFDAADECAGLDGMVTARLWQELGYPPENFACEIRWGRDFRNENFDAFVWAFLCPGMPPMQLSGWVQTGEERQGEPEARLGEGAGTRTGRPGWIVWSRVFVEEGRFCYDTGIAEVVALPSAETVDRLRLTASRETVLHVVLQGVTRDQMLARHKAGRVQVVCAPNKEGARRGLFAKAAAMRELGLEVAVCGNLSGER